jgi:hypothetical protein
MRSLSVNRCGEARLIRCLSRPPLLSISAVRNPSEYHGPGTLSGDSTSEEFDLLIPTLMSPAVRGPAMTRIGLLLIATVAALGLTIAWVEHRMTVWGVLFFTGEQILPITSFTIWRIVDLLENQQFVTDRPE